MKDLKELVAFVCDIPEVGEGVVKLVKEKNPGVLVAALLPIIPDAISAFAGLDQLKADLVALDDAGKEELKALVKSKIDLDDDVVEGYVEFGLSMLIEILSVVKSFLK